MSRRKPVEHLFYLDTPIPVRVKGCDGIALVVARDRVYARWFDGSTVHLAWVKNWTIPRQGRRPMTTAGRGASSEPTSGASAYRFVTPSQRVGLPADMAMEPPLTDAEWQPFYDAATGRSGAPEQLDLTTLVASTGGDDGEEVNETMPRKTNQRLVVAGTTHQLPNTLSVSDAVEHAGRMPDESVDLIVFSPPYDGVRDYKGDWTIDLPALGEHLLRVAKDGAFAVIVMGDGTKDQRKSMTTFRTAVAWSDAGWSLFESVIYSRDGRPGAWWATRFRVDHEFILMFYKGKRPRPVEHHEGLRVPSKHAGKKWTGTQRLTDGTTIPITATVADTKCRGTIWHYATSNSEGNKPKMAHPATYPDALARDLILALSSPQDVVYDPMVGSGTTAVVAAQTGRRWIGNDVSADYIEIARTRLAVEADAYEAPVSCVGCGNDDACQGYDLCPCCLEAGAA